LTGDAPDIQTASSRSFLGGGRGVDPETVEIQQTLDEMFENIVVVDQLSPHPDDDWMPGEFDVT
jgi:hypothetical protein